MRILVGFGRVLHLPRRPAAADPDSKSSVSFNERIPLKSPPHPFTRSDAAGYLPHTPRRARGPSLPISSAVAFGVATAASTAMPAGPAGRLRAGPTRECWVTAAVCRVTRRRTWRALSKPTPSQRAGQCISCIFCFFVADLILNFHRSLYNHIWIRRWYHVV